MLAHLDSGISAAEGARLALLEREDVPVPVLADDPMLGATATQLRQALDAFDEPGAHAALDRLLSAFALETVLRDAVMPYLQELGQRWLRGEASVGQEHFASALLRGRLLGLARGWGLGIGPLALLACPSGEQHDLPLLLFGISLRSAGWRIAFLGANTPVETIERAAAELQPDAVVLSAVAPEHLLAVERELTELARRTTVAIGGHGADLGLAERVGAVRLEGDLVTAAATFARRVRP